jgi:hypothetical protein
MTSASSTNANALRRPASDFPGIVGVTLLPLGAEATLLNISTTGLLSESTARLPVGSPVTVQFRGTFSPLSVVGRVVRCEVAAMGHDGLLRYAIAVEFASPISLGDDSGVQSFAAPSQAARNRW